MKDRYHEIQSLTLPTLLILVTLLILLTLVTLLTLVILLTILRGSTGTRTAQCTRAVGKVALSTAQACTGTLSRWGLS